MDNNFEKGSIWRKWDLQVQTRLDKDYKCLSRTLSSKKLEQLESATGLTEAEITSQEESMAPEKYAKLLVNYITLFTDISVVAITDHNSGKELDYIINEAKTSEGKLSVIAGVEVSSSQGIHMLCLFDSEKPWRENWANSIEHFLTEIGLTSGGFNSSGQPIDGTKSCQEIMKIVAEKGGICIFAHISTQNGLFYSHSSTNNGGTAHKDIYCDKYCQIVQIPQTADPGIGVKNIIEGKDHNYGNKKVTQIKCSDARKLSDIGMQFVWIKANPTFDGLKQIIFEAEGRAKIQDSNPYQDRSKIYFDSLKLAGSSNFILKDFEIPLNRELITLIGGRGSGKSAMLECIAFFNEEHLKLDQNGKKKILEYYRDNEGRSEPRPSFKLKISLVDKDNQTSKYEKSLSEKTNFELPFLYLGQERLSGIATNDFELTRTVCDLIGIDIDEIGQDSLISRARDLLGEINNTEQGINDVVEKYKVLGCENSTNLESWIADYLLKLTEQQKKLSSKETKSILDTINKKTERGIKLRESIDAAKVISIGLSDLPISTDIAEFNIKVRKLYPEIEEIGGIDVSNQKEALALIQRKMEKDISDLREEVLTLKRELIDAGIREDVNTLLQASETLQRQISNVEKDLANYKQSMELLKELHLEKEKILIQIKEMLNSLQLSITKAFSDFRDSRNDSTVEEKELFEKIMSGIEIEGNLEFDFKTFSKRLLNDYIDNRKIANETELRKAIAGIDEHGVPREVSFDDLMKWIQKENLPEQKYFNRNGFNGVLAYVFTEWGDFLKVRAIAKLNGKSTEVLSIGQRGTLLLKVYLATATAKQIFIIDQPEDNLDNNFIMNELVPLIRKAKQSRQIIMSTHNANLVVNSDAEQIIVARLDQEQGYLSGSIENSEINKSIRDILEGGEEAFRQREKKYLFEKAE